MFATQGPFATEVEAACAWDTMKSSALGFQKPNLLNFPGEYKAAVGAAAGAAA
jgi:hypothetical protein